MIIMVIAALAYLIGNLTPQALEARRAQRTEEALTQAREALIGYALQYRERQIATGTYDAMYGYLPMPDVGTSRFHPTGQPASCNTEGCAMQFMNGAFPADTDTVIGRLPWKTLGLEPLRDGHGECLWYIVSANHKDLGISTTVRMNWDTPGQIDIVATNDADPAKLKSLIASAHDRPVAIIFSPGPAFGGQNRGPIGTDDVTQCGGNYNPANYLDPNLAAALLDHTGNPTAASAYYSGATTANDTPSLAIATQGKVYKDGSSLTAACPAGNTNCTLVANDNGLGLGSDMLFGAIRKHAYFRTDINSLLDRITDCLRDQTLSGYSKITGADNDSCYGTGLAPRGYYPHYKEMIFVAGGSTMNVNGTSCSGALLFSNERNNNWNPSGEPSGNTPACPKFNAGNTYQCRTNATEKADSSNYLEGINLTNFGGGTTFSGPEILERISSTQSRHRDIVRCIPSTRSFVTTQSPGLIAAGLPQLATYTPGTRTITLGQGIATALGSSLANYLYGCAWRPETHTLGGGLRSYFTFRINDAGGATWPTLGFTFTVADGDNNGIDACGASAQHLGYSGSNTESPFIALPKVAFEVDLRRETGFTPALADHLLNGRNDPPSPSYRGGHVAIDYWGGETSFSAMPFASAPAPKCTAPAFDPGFGTNCFLPQEEDDNVHGRSPLARAGFPTPPANPAVPATELAVPPDAPMGAYKLDPDLTGTPVNQYFHVRVELTRTPPLNIRVATATNLNIAAPGNPVNGVMLTAGDRVWVRQQTIQAENGFYVWNGSGVPMTPVPTPIIESATNFSLPRVRVATTGIIDLSLPGDNVDSVYLSAGDRILVKNQALASENGVYVWQAANLPLIRASDADSPAELAGMVVEVQQGAVNARSIWRQNTTNLALDTTALSWTNIRVKLAAPATTNLASPGAELDGIKMKAGDRVFVKTMGIYIWNGASVPMTAASDIASGSVVQILQGSEAGAWWRYDGGWQRLSVRVASQSSLDLSAPGATIDGIAMAAGDRVLIKNQASETQNGMYQWNGAAIPMTRTTDADASSELAGALTQVLEGSDVGRAFRQTSHAANDTLGADAVRWAAIDRSTSYLLEIWILLDSPSYTSKIAAMQDTTRPMSILYPTFTPHLQDRPVIPYSFRNARLGFTIGQRTSINDQTVLISNSTTTWLP